MKFDRTNMLIFKKIVSKIIIDSFEMKKKILVKCVNILTLNKRNIQKHKIFEAYLNKP